MSSDPISNVAQPTDPWAFMQAQSSDEAQLEADAAAASPPEIGSTAYATAMPLPMDSRRLMLDAYLAAPGHEPKNQPVDLSGFSIDMILQYVQMRLTDIDGQIHDLQGDAESRKKQSDELRTFQNAVRSLVGVGKTGQGYDSETSNNDEVRKITNADADQRLTAAMSEVKDNPTLVAKLQALHDDIFEGGANGSKIDAQTLQNNLDWAKDQLTSINSDNELTMMRLNSLIQLRSQIISSASNEQASIHEGMKTVIGNMRA